MWFCRSTALTTCGRLLLKETASSLKIENDILSESRDSTEERLHSTEERLHSAAREKRRLVDIYTGVNEGYARQLESQKTLTRVFKARLQRFEVSRRRWF